MNIERMQAVAKILIEDGGVDAQLAYCSMEHDVIFFPWSETAGEVAEKLEAVGCHYNEGCWASF